MRLRNKIILIFTCCFTLGFSFLFALVNYTITNTNESITNSLSTQVIESKAEVAGSWLNQRLSELRTIAQSDAVLTMNLEEAKPFIDRLNQQLSQLYGNEWGTFAIGKNDGLGWVSDTSTIDVSQRPYFQEAMNSDSEYVLSTPVVSKTDKAPIVLLCYPLLNEQGEKYGFINGAISLEKLSEISDSIDFYEGTSWIMDNHETLYTNTENLNPNMLQSLKSAFDYYSPENIDTGRLYDEATNHTVFYTPIPNTEHWFLCVEVDNAILMKDTQQLLTGLIVIWALVLCIAIISCIILSNSITKPLAKLNKIMKRVENGDLTGQADESGHDEIAGISRAFNQMLSRIKSLMKQIVNDEKDKRSAELQVLQSQINPHFLYNTLDTLQWKAYEYDDEKMVDLIAALSGFFRISLSKGKEFIPISKEIEHVTNYLFIQQYRFSEILDYSIEIDESLNEFYTLKLILQPLIENSIQHGIKPKQLHCQILIQGTRDGNEAVFKIIDNGVGIDEATLAKLRHDLSESKQGLGYGLYNVNRRCKLIYGNHYGLEIESKLGEGCCVILRIPLAINEEDYAENMYL